MHCPTLHSTALHSTLLHSKPPNSTAFHHTAQDFTAPHSTPRHLTPLHSTTLHSAFDSTPLHSTPHRTCLQVLPVCFTHKDPNSLGPSPYASHPTVFKSSIRSVHTALQEMIQRLEKSEWDKHPLKQSPSVIDVKAHVAGACQLSSALAASHLSPVCHMCRASAQ